MLGILGMGSYGIFWAGVHSDTGVYLMYPFYLDFKMRYLMCLGSWQVLYIIVWVSADHVVSKYDPAIFKFVVGSSMWVYISHDLWQAIVVCVFFASGEYNFWFCMLTTLILGHMLTLLSYWALSKCC